jgi:hypothetical protein
MNSLPWTEELIEGYSANVADGFHSRWNSCAPEIYDNEISEAVGGLAARQSNLAIEMARNPGIWNVHIAPLVLRCMIDAHITLAWILVSPKDRSRDYIRYGLGQEKLFLEYLKNEADGIPEGEFDGGMSEVINEREAWMNSQLLEWAIEVNVGSWSGTSVRDMASESGCESLYKFVYVPFSGAVHNMWQHVGVNNMVTCLNPMHKFHRIPLIWSGEIDADYLYRSSKYVSRTFQLLDQKLGSSSEVQLPVDYFIESIGRNLEGKDGAG